MADEERINSLEQQAQQQENESSKLQKEYKSAIFSAYRDFYKLSQEEQAEYTVNETLA